MQRFYFPNSRGEKMIPTARYILGITQLPIQNLPRAPFRAPNRNIYVHSYVIQCKKNLLNTKINKIY